MPHVFLSYRRSDSQAIADRMYDRLVKEFSSENVFKDVDSIPLGVDFRQTIQDAVSNAGAFLAVIGPNWANAIDDAGRRRLDDPSDFVRIEIETALARTITLVPVTVANAAMPRASDLPDTLRELVFRQGIDVRSDPDFHNDMTRLVTSIRQFFGESGTLQHATEEPLSGHFVEVLKHRAQMALEYIYAQREAALADVSLSGGPCSRGEIERRYHSAIAAFPRLHEQYLEALRNKNGQLAHELLGELYLLMNRCRHSRYEDPPRLCSQ